MKFKASVFGLGKAGLSLAAVIADSGINAIGVDVSKAVVEKINSGKSSVPEEPGLDELVSKNINKTLIATTDASSAMKNSNVHIIIVPLYIGEDMNPNYENVLAVASVIGRNLKKGDLVVLETTAPVGTTDTLLRNELEKTSGLKIGEFFLAHSPERIMTGYSISRFKEFPKVVGGIDKKSGDLTEKFYEHFCSKVIKVKDARTAELVKIAEGVYRDVNIGIANELSQICDAYGINFWEMRRAAAHEYCNILEPGIGVGGHCIPVYPHFLIQDKKLKGLPNLTKTAREVNNAMAEYIAQKALNVGNKNAKILVVGLTYREGVKELAYTRTKTLISSLKQKGADVSGIDPLLSSEEVKNELGIEAISEKDDWSAFDRIIIANKEKKYINKLSTLAKDRIIDTKNLLGLK